MPKKKKNVLLTEKDKIEKINRQWKPMKTALFTAGLGIFGISASTGALIPLIMNADNHISKMLKENGVRTKKSPVFSETGYIDPKDFRTITLTGFNFDAGSQDTSHWKVYQKYNSDKTYNVLSISVSKDPVLDPNGNPILNEIGHPEREITITLKDRIPMNELGKGGLDIIVYATFSDNTKCSATIHVGTQLPMNNATLGWNNSETKAGDVSIETTYLTREMFDVLDFTMDYTSTPASTDSPNYEGSFVPATFKDPDEKGGDGVHGLITITPVLPIWYSINKQKITVHISSKDKNIFDPSKSLGWNSEVSISIDAHEPSFAPQANAQFDKYGHTDTLIVNSAFVDKSIADKRFWTVQSKQLKKPYNIKDIRFADSESKDPNAKQNGWNTIYIDLDPGIDKVYQENDIEIQAKWNGFTLNASVDINVNIDAPTITNGFATPGNINDRTTSFTASVKNFEEQKKLDSTNDPKSFVTLFDPSSSDPEISKNKYHFVLQNAGEGGLYNLSLAKVEIFRGINVQTDASKDPVWDYDDGDTLKITIGKDKPDVAGWGSLTDASETRTFTMQWDYPTKLGDNVSPTQYSYFQMPGEVPVHLQNAHGAGDTITVEASEIGVNLPQPGSDGNVVIPKDFSGSPVSFDDEDLYANNLDPVSSGVKDGLWVRDLDTKGTRLRKVNIDSATVRYIPIDDTKDIILHYKKVGNGDAREIDWDNSQNIQLTPVVQDNGKQGTGYVGKEQVTIKIKKHPDPSQETDKQKQDDENKNVWDKLIHQTESEGGEQQIYVGWNRKNTSRTPEHTSFTYHMQEPAQISSAVFSPQLQQIAITGSNFIDDKHGDSSIAEQHLLDSLKIYVKNGKDIDKSVNLKDTNKIAISKLEEGNLVLKFQTPFYQKYNNEKLELSFSTIGYPDNLISTEIALANIQTVSINTGNATNSSVVLTGTNLDQIIPNDILTNPDNASKSPSKYFAKIENLDDRMIGKGYGGKNGYLTYKSSDLSNSEKQIITFSTPESINQGIFIQNPIITISTDFNDFSKNNDDNNCLVAKTSDTDPSVNTISPTTNEISASFSEEWDSYADTSLSNWWHSPDGNNTNLWDGNDSDKSHKCPNPDGKNDTDNYWQGFGGGRGSWTQKSTSISTILTLPNLKTEEQNKLKFTMPSATAEAGTNANFYRDGWIGHKISTDHYYALNEVWYSGWFQPAGSSSWGGFEARIVLWYTYDSNSGEINLNGFTQYNNHDDENKHWIRVQIFIPPAKISISHN